MIASALLFCLLQAGVPRSSAPENALTVVAHYSVERGHVLRMTVLNDGTAAVDINEVWLPWGHVYSTLLVAIRPTDPFTGSRPLERTIVMANPVGTSLTLRPGQTMSGDIDLDRQFADLAKALVHSDILLFWSYAPIYTGGRVGERAGGWVQLPQENR